MELLSRMMDGSISYDPRDRLGPVLCGSENRQVGRIDFEQIPILAGCSQKQLRIIARIARVLDAAAGTVLIRRGEPGDEFFLILDGTVSVEVSPERSVPLGPGTFFGEMSLLDGGTRSATVVSETPVRLLVIHRENFSILCREVPDLTQTLSVTLSRRLRQAEEPTGFMGGAASAWVGRSHSEGCYSASLTVTCKRLGKRDRSVSTCHEPMPRRPSAKMP